MKVKELIKQLQQTGKDNNVSIENEDGVTDKLYLSFDDVGDVLIYQVE